VAPAFPESKLRGNRCAVWIQTCVLAGSGAGEAGEAEPDLPPGTVTRPMCT